MNSNKKIEYLKNKVSSKNKVNFAEFLIHLSFLILSFISILKCKITKIKTCNYSISFPKTKGIIDFRGRYITDHLNFRKSINFFRSTSYLNSIMLYIKYPNVVFFLSIHYFANITDKSHLKNYSKDVRTQNFVKKIFEYLKIRKLISIDDQRVMSLFLNICKQLKIKSLGYMHYRFNKKYEKINHNAFDTFFVWSKYFKKRLIKINKQYVNKNVVISGVENKKFKKTKKKIDVLFVWDLESNLTKLGNLIQNLNSKFNIAVKFKPSSQIDEKKLLIFLKKNNILYFQNKSFSEIRNKYYISYFIGCSTTALYEACLYDALPIIIKNNSSIAKEIVSEGIIKSTKINFKKISSIIKKKPSKEKIIIQRKKIWGNIIYNKKVIIQNLYK